ncbi:response regulator [Desulforhopalus sp. IMCC35007]|uniref:hybrid sensor histidine kinase/response regulator n=1 Tax=Desulforhopalus sp. IMCC35007 TaxID=2569543 RepID=UPI0010AEB879|nr:response regulator [Desulforhopalus sp. IMCC35007]TKB06718.1 response regulator [Desulforhopalus sp. IMCC35007]
MGFHLKQSSRFIFIPVLFFIVFIVVSALYIQYQNRVVGKQFANHAAIISDDIWALDSAGASIYLRLAMKADHYKSLNVSIPGMENFISLQQGKLTGISYLLHEAGLIGTKQLSQEIFSKGEQIGTLSGVKYVRIIFPLINILIVLLLVLLTISFIMFLIQSRRHLEEEVEIRTRKLRSSEQRFHDLVNFLPEIVLETGMDGNITYANQAAKNRLDPELTSGKAQSFLDYIVENDRNDAENNFYTSLKGEPIELQEYSVIGYGNIPFPVLLKIAPLYTNDMSVGGARMIAIDISSRRRLEEQLLRDQKMKAIGLMAGGVAHDLNNILSGIISYPDLLLLNMSEKDKLYKPLQSIRRSGLDAAEVVSDLLTVARGVAASTEITSLNDLIAIYLESADFRELISQHPDVQIETRLDPALRNVKCAPIQVRKCLMNIINNGIESISGRGMVTISTINEHCFPPLNEEAKDTTVKRNASLQKQNFSKIIIRDTGKGINDEEMRHIFEPFYSTKVLGRSGTGLGLTIVWNTMREHGGTVHVTSSSSGTTFELFFPSINGKINHLPKKDNWQDYIGTGQRILVVDDEPRQLEILTGLLASLNYATVAVSSGEEAEQFLRQNCVDLVVLDMIMSPGQNGRTTYENILKIHPKQKAVIASGFAKDDDVKATLAMGASYFIAKPYTIEQIGRAIYKTLNS